MMDKVFIVSPAMVATGGTELLQQLCAQINKYEKKAYMIYVGIYENSEVQERFRIYDNPTQEAVEDLPCNVVIIPETHIDWIRKYKKAKIYVWWLSVDNYYGAGRLKVDLAHKMYYKIKDTLNIRYFRKYQHLVQSMYAKDFLIKEKKISENQIFYLSDYLNHVFLDNAMTTITKRKNHILYNPKKGIENTRLLMKIVTEYSWIPLQGFTPGEMQQIMKESKVYIDFGSHPGKDRIPREAAICGCCVIIGKNGAAANCCDVPIDEKYKFDNMEENIEKIAALIRSCISSYEMHVNEFQKYRESILGEEKKFEDDVRTIFFNGDNLKGLDAM